jgi:large subunit ribosomal protein L32e
MTDDSVTVRYVGDRTSFRSDPTGILREDETAAVSEAAADRLLENWPFEVVNDDSAEADDDSESSDEDDSTEDDTLTDLNGVGKDTADDLRAAGYETPADVRDANSDELTDVDGIGEATAADLVDESGG